MTFIMIPRAVVLKRQRKREQDARARHAYETRNAGRKRHGEARTAARRMLRDKQEFGRPFVMWDGEGPQDAGYALFGNSDGLALCHPFLGTVECLELLIQSAENNPTAINVAFGFNYDVSMILRELPKRHLRALHTHTRTTWQEWRIEHVPHKWFKVSKDGISIVIYDIRSFFGGNYESALSDFGIGTEAERAQISAGKGGRADFVWADIESIRRYWRRELILGVKLMEKLRQVFHDAGYVPRSWHGPGALARMAFKRHKIYDAMAECPPDVRLAAQYAFAGGRFELFQSGHIGERIYNADIHSAYPYFATHLPNLARGTWRYARNYEAGKFGVYYVKYDAKPDNTRAFPLFRRLPNGSVVWPNRAEGWYWAPEAECVADDPDATFLDGWIFDEDDPTDRPFAFLAEYYDKRKRLKDAGSAAEYTFKLIINSIYGQLAQRVGWDRRHNCAPRTHQLEWAGYITSACRAAVYRASTLCGDKLVSIDTDGIYATCPIGGLAYSSRLGEWDSAEYDDGIFWQSGIYCLKTGDGWQKARSRGIKKGSYTAEELLTALSNINCGNSECTTTEYHLHLTKRLFVTYGLAQQIGWDKFNTWRDEPHEFVMGGGKRMHFPRSCKTLCRPPAHRLHQWSPTYGQGADDDARSRRHYLPWLGEHDDDRDAMEDMQLFNANHLDPDDEWVIGYSHV
jgi:DNA polymerase family B